MQHLWFDWLYLATLLLFLIEVLKLIRILLSRSKVKSSSPVEYPFVSVIIPVRNEELRVTECLNGITNQTYPNDRYEIIAIDDHSEDNSLEVLRSFEKKSSNLTVMLNAGAIPEGWGGKSYANHLASKKAKGEFLVFMDADVAAQPDMLAQVVNHFLRHKLDVASIVPFRILQSLTEKILLAPVFLIIAIAFEEKKVKLSGEFILFRRHVYEALGGHSAVKSTVSDDLDLALLLEKTDYKTDFLFAEKFAATRMYRSLQSIYEGISKMYQRLVSENEWLAAWRSAKYFLFALISVTALILYFRNFRSQLFSSEVLLVLPTAMLALFVGMTFYLRIGFIYGILMPLGWLFQPALMFRSIMGKYRKYHVWRGRKVFKHA